MKLAEATILIIDDEEDLLNMYATKLSAAGFNALTSSDGYEGIDKAKTDQPDLILLDVLMPGLSGTDVLLKLKEDPQTKNIPVIFLTNLQDKPEDIRLAKEAGAVDFLNKAMELELLVEYLQTYLNVEPNK